MFAIEASNTSDLCRRIVTQNNLADKVTVLAGRAEDIQLPENLKADILISEWMGFYLLHESMLNSVIVARDRFLSPDGIMVPSAATLYMCPVAMKEYHHEHFNFWKDVYGFDLSPAQVHARQARIAQPQILTINPASCLAEPQMILNIELMYIGVEDLRNIFASPTFVINKNDLLHGFAYWFDVEFDSGGEKRVVLSTSPSSPDTHWHQTVVILPDTLLVSVDEQVSCLISLTQDSKNTRRYNITIEIPEEEDESEDEHDKENDMEGDASTEASMNFTHNLQELIKNAMTSK